jgi:hypothetical protein
MATEDSPVTIRIEVGPQAQLSTRLRAALDELSVAIAEAELGGNEVEGFTFGAGGGSFMDVGGSVPKPTSKYEPPIKAGGCIGNYYDEETNSTSCWINWG